MRRTLLVALLMAGCSEAVQPEPAARPDAEPQGGGVYASEGPGAAPCGAVAWPVPGADGGIAWETRYVPCGATASGPVSDPPIEDEWEGVPEGADPRPGPPGDPTPWR